jgi:transcriptional regulator with XRE-family HTH domain
MLELERGDRGEMMPKTTSIDVVFEQWLKDPKFREEMRKTQPYFDVAVQVIKRRSELVGTQAELAQASGLTRNTITKVESGASNLSLKSLTAIAEALGCEVVIWLKPIDAAGNAEATE